MNVKTAFPVFETERLRLRELREEDAPQLLKLRGDERVMLYMDRETTKTPEEAQKMALDTINIFHQEQGIIWAVTLKDDDSDTLIGYAGYHRRMKEDFRAEICYALLPGYWGRGFITEATAEVIRYGFGEMNLHSIEGNVSPGNTVSIKILEKFGFQQEAYFKENIFFNGEFRDTAIYSLLNPGG